MKDIPQENDLNDNDNIHEINGMDDNSQSNANIVEDEFEISENVGMKDFKVIKKLGEGS